MNTSNTIPSPCVDICALDDNDICIGCYRHGMEISRWGTYTEAQKKEVLARIRRREAGHKVAALT